MSKSKGEFLTLSLLAEKGYDPMVYRFFCLQSHYRKSLVFSYENMDNAKTAYEKLIAKIAALKSEGEIDREAYSAERAKFVAALDNDLNTSLAVTAVYDVLKAKTNDATKLALLAEYDRVLCLNLLENAELVRKSEAGNKPEIPAELAAKIEGMIEARRQAKAEKNYAEADRIRAELTAMGVTLTDTKAGTTYTVAT